MWVAAVLCLATCGYGLYATLLGNGQTTWAAIVAVFALLTMVDQRIAGDFFMIWNSPAWTYAHFVASTVLVFFLLWSSVMANVDAKQVGARCRCARGGDCTSHAPPSFSPFPPPPSLRGQAYERVEENWFMLQNTLLIPFTTQLEQKRFVQDVLVVTSWLGICTGLFCLYPVLEAWKALGGTFRLVQSRWSIFLPEFIVLFAAAGITLAFDESAAMIAAFATPYSTAAIVAQSGFAGLVVIMLLIMAYLLQRYGSNVWTHWALATVYGPLGFLMVITSSVTISRAQLVDDYVKTNWSTLKYVVPPEYATRPYDKYALASYTPMMAAGSTGLLLALMTLAAAAVHVRCAAALEEAGTELYKLSVRDMKDLESDDDASLVMSAQALRLSARGVVVELPSDPDSHDRAAGVGSGGAGGARDASGDGTGIAGDADEATGITSGFNRQAYVRSGSFYNPYPAAPLSGEPGFRFAALPGSSIASPLSEPIPTPSVSAPPAPPGLEKSTYDHAVLSATAAYARYLVEARVPPIGLRKRYEEDELAKRSASCPPVRRICGTACHEAIGVMRASWCTFLLIAILTIIAVGGMGGGLGVLTAQGRCGVLGNNAARVTYARWFDVDFAHNVAITHDFPFGAVEVDISHQDRFGSTNVSGAAFLSPMLTAHSLPSPSPHARRRRVQFTVEVTYFAASASDLPAFATFNASLNLTQYGHGADDDYFYGYQQTNIGLVAPSDAARRCLGARIRVITGAAFMNYVINSKGAFVNMSGNFVDLTGNPAATPTLTTAQVTTAAGAVVLNNIYSGFPGSTPLPDPNSQSFRIPPSLVVRSDVGDVSLTDISAGGVDVVTGGTIRSATVGSSLLLYCVGACGDISYRTTGAGRISITQAFAANNIAVATEDGDIAADNVAAIVGRQLNFTSSQGRIYLSNFLQLSGNETFITTANDVSLSVAYANKLMVTTTGTGKISVLEAFIGLAPSDLVKPPVVGNYTTPLFYLHAESGGISVLGFGNNPSSTIYADTMSVDVASSKGDVKVEINGGGYNGKYTASAPRGLTLVEVDGQPVDSSGVIGTTSQGFNLARVTSEYGDVQLSVLPSPL